MPAPKLTRHLFWAAEILLLVGTLAAAAWFSRSAEWHPLPVLVLVLVLAFLGEWATVKIGNEILSASLVVTVLAMSLLGPGPAVLCGIASITPSSASRRLPPVQWLNNLSTFAFAPFAAALLLRTVADNVHGGGSQQFTQNIIFGLIVLGATIAYIGLNFILIGLDTRISDGRSFARQVSEFRPLVSGELATAALAVIIVVGYRSAGLPMLFASIGVLLIFRHLMVALMRSEERAEQLLARSTQLVRLQLGVLTTLVRALGMRDKTIERHGAAVARYAKALAGELGCSDQERDVVRAAGLLHEIGKFTWPDRILHAEVLEGEDLAIAKKHPQEGSVLVGALDGYGAVADAILYHHERMDGRGYPAGLIGSEIPLASRILAICSTYDTMIMGRPHRPAMAPEEAIEELRTGARNGQLDPELVESFIVLLERDDAMFADEADFETELEFERRVRDMAEPRSPNPASHTRPRARTRDGRNWRTDLSSIRQRALNKG
jgi:putative nucleotidyltransferase with HDIG domain